MCMFGFKLETKGKSGNFGPNFWAVAVHGRGRKGREISMEKKNGESGRVGEKTPTKKPKRFLVCAWAAMRCAGNWRENFEVFGL